MSLRVKHECLDFHIPFDYYCTMFRKDKLKNLIEETGISYSELDRRIGAAGGGMVSKYVRGDRSPSPELLYKFLRGLGWTDDQLSSERLTDWYPVTVNGAAPPG